MDIFERDLPRDNNGVLGLPVSPELASFVIQKTRLLAIAFPVVFEISLYGTPRCPLRDICRRLNDSERHVLQCCCQLRSIIALIERPQLLLEQ